MYQLLKEHQHSYEMKHPDGSTFHVAKKGLKKEVHDKIKSLAPKGYAEGGEVEAPKEPIIDQSRSPAAVEESGSPRMQVEQVPNIGSPNMQVEQVVEPTIEPPRKPAQDFTAPEKPMIEQTPKAQGVGFGVQQKPSAPMPDYAKRGGSFEQNLKMQEAGISGAAKAQAQGGEEQAKAYEQAFPQGTQDALKKQMEDYRLQKTKIAAENDQLTKDVMNAKINPNAYWENMSTGSRVLTAVSMILGGMGAGLTGKSNAVVDQVNAEIQRDIEAQKANLGKKENLLSMNMKKYGDLQAAEQATYMQLNSVVQGQIAAIGARTNSKVAQANATAAIGQLRNQALPMQQDLAIKQALMQSAGGVQQPTSGEQAALKVRLLVPEGRQKDAYEEVKTAQGLIKGQASINQAFDKLSKINTYGNLASETAKLSPFELGRQVNAIKGPITAELSKETAGRFTEQDAELLDGLWPAKGDSAETLAVKKRQINDLLAKKMNFPVLDSYGIKVSNLYNPHGETAIKESKR